LARPVLERECCFCKFVTKFYVFIHTDVRTINAQHDVIRTPYLQCSLYCHRPLSSITQLALLLPNVPHATDIREVYYALPHTSDNADQLILVLVIQRHNARWCPLQSSQVLTRSVLVCSIIDINSTPFLYITQPFFLSLPRLFAPSMTPKHHCFISLSACIWHPCPNRFNVHYITLCKMSTSIPSHLLASIFVIFCDHESVSVFCSISFKML